MAGIVPIKLSALTGQLQQTIQDVFAGQSFWVIADVTNYSFHSQKSYHYFDLVEKAEGNNQIQAKICAAAWGIGNTKIKNFERITGQKFKNDINVLIKVSVEYHPAYGLKLVVLDVDANFTIGLLEQQRQRTIERLLTECASFISKKGDVFYTRNKALPLKPVIQFIAVVTSKASAGLQDFRHTLDHNAFDYRFRVDNYYAAVQGEGSSVEMYNVLLEIYNTGIPYDAIIIIRGGGAQTDFMLFDQFPLCKIVAKYPIPVITGIGHQKNETIVDLMSHTSTKTPTKAAEFIVAHNRKYEEQMLSLQQQILIKSQQLFSTNFQKLSGLHTQIVNCARTNLSAHKDALVKLNQTTINTTKTIVYNRHHDILNLSTQILSRPKIAVAARQKDLESISSNLRSYVTRNLANQQGYINHFVTVFRLMNPDAILKKGFAIVKKDGMITSDPDNIWAGSKISIILSTKEIHTTVTSKTDYNGNEFKL